MPARNPLNYGYYIQGYKSVGPTGNPHNWVEALGSGGILFLDQRFSRFHMAERGREWARLRGHVAIQLRYASYGFSSSRAVGCIMGVN